MHDEAVKILNACLIAMDHQNPNMIAAKQIALDLAKMMIRSEEYETAEDLLKYVLREHFNRVKKSGVSGLSGISVEQMTTDTTNILFKQMDVSLIFEMAAELLEKLQRLQSSSNIVEDPSVGVEVDDQESSGEILDIEHLSFANNLPELLMDAERNEDKRNVDE